MIEHFLTEAQRPLGPDGCELPIWERPGMQIPGLDFPVGDEDFEELAEDFDDDQGDDEADETLREAAQGFEPSPEDRDWLAKTIAAEEWAEMCNRAAWEQTRAEAGPEWQELCEARMSYDSRCIE